MNKHFLILSLFVCVNQSIAGMNGYILPPSQGRQARVQHQKINAEVVVNKPISVNKDNAKVVNNVDGSNIDFIKKSNESSIDMLIKASEKYKQGLIDKDQYIQVAMQVSQMAEYYNLAKGSATNNATATATTKTGNTELSSSSGAPSLQAAQNIVVPKTSEELYSKVIGPSSSNPRVYLTKYKGSPQPVDSSDLPAGEAATTNDIFQYDSYGNVWHSFKSGSNKIITKYGLVNSSGKHVERSQDYSSDGFTYDVYEDGVVVITSSNGKTGPGGTVLGTWQANRELCKLVNDIRNEQPLRIEGLSNCSVANPSVASTPEIPVVLPTFGTGTQTCQSLGYANQSFTSRLFTCWTQNVGEIKGTGWITMQAECSGATYDYFFCPNR